LRDQGRGAAVRQGNRDGVRNVWRRHPRQLGAPGIIDTPIWGKIPTGAADSGQNAPIDPEERAKMATPLGRAGHAEKIAQGVLYLASDASRYVTGTELVIDGGMNAGGVARRG